MLLSTLFMFATSAQTDLFANESSRQASNVTLYIIGAVFVIGLIALMVYGIAGLWRTYVKLGEKGWKIFIPIYNNWVFLRLGGQREWWAVLALIPVVNIVSVIMICIAAHNIGKRLQRSSAFVLVYIFFYPIWSIILGYGKHSTPAVTNTPDAPTFMPPVASTLPPN